jgi:hypothetical protein
MPNPIDDTGANGGNVPQKKAGAFTLSETPVFGEVEAGDAHKYDVGPHTAAVAASAPEFDDLGALPASYGEDTLFLAARDPRWLFAYWDFDWTRYPATTMRGGLMQYFLKILHTDGTQETIVEIAPEARNWYVSVSKPDTLYSAEIGFFARDGAWVPAVASGVARTPAESLAEDEAASFATVPLHLSFERMLDLVRQQMESGETLLGAVARVTDHGRHIAFQAGRAPSWTDEQRALLAALLGQSLIDRMGLGSAELDQLLRRELLERLHSERASGFMQEIRELFAPGVSSLFSGVTSLFSAVGASWSAQPFSARFERGFFMHVNAEIIFYGGTHPDATVWVDGKQIALRPDGTFRYHFTLPDGDFAIPIVARSPDGVEQRSAALSFARSTAKTGEVNDTAQPPFLSPLIGRK